MNLKTVTIPRILVLVLAMVFQIACSTNEQVQPSRARLSDAVVRTSWQTFVGPEVLKRNLGKSGVVVVDVRSPEKYAEGHIPTAINLPGASLRTAKAKPGEGDSQYFFRTEDGKPDVAKYEEIFSAAGISNSDTVFVYGNHAGKGDGTIPVMILQWLGHENAYFLNGVGVDEWTRAGYELTKEKSELARSQYKANASPKFVWNLSDVLANLSNPNVIFGDTRSLAEYEGRDKRNNKYGGHIPGAIRIDYADMLDGEKKVISPSQISDILLSKGITPDKKIVLYCQTSTRVSLTALALRDLGYEDVVIYDASWHEYGNREGTPINLRK